MTKVNDAVRLHRTRKLGVVATPSCAAVVPLTPDAAQAAPSSGRLGPARGWLSVGAVALGAFVLVMTETLPVGLLPQIADGLHVSVGLAGLTVLIPGFSAALAAPLFFVGSGRFDRRPVILLLGLTILVSNAGVAIAPDFVVVVIARMLFGATLGAFWTVVAPIGPKLVGPEGGTRAITIIAAGISGGTVVGLPAGQLLSHIVGWRIAFVVAAAATLLVVVAQALLLPSIPPDTRTHLRDLIAVVARRAAQYGMAAGAIVFIGQFTAWTYVTPFLMDHALLSSGTISLLYVIYGCGGILGSLIAGTLFKRTVIVSFAIAGASVGVLLIGLAHSDTSPWLTGLLLVLWGLLWGIVNPGTLVWILDAAPETPEAASAVNVTNLQVAVGLGAGLGAVLVSSTSLSRLFIAAGLIVLAAALLAAIASHFVRLAPRK